jgi:hypothetical protein
VRSFFGLQDLLLTSNVGHNQGDGGQVTGAENDADCTPQEAAKGGDGRSACYPVIDRQKEGIEHSVHFPFAFSIEIDNARRTYPMFYPTT